MSQQDDRTVVRTYVPEYQADEWAEEADSMGMSLSEFVRSMVQAGRNDLGLEESTAGTPVNPAEPGSGGATPGGEPLEDRVLQTLDKAETRSWDDLVDALAGNFEDRLQEALDALMESGRIKMDHRRGGYRLREDD